MNIRLQLRLPRGREIDHGRANGERQRSVHRCPRDLFVIRMVRSQPCSHPTRLRTAERDRRTVGEGRRCRERRRGREKHLRRGELLLACRTEGASAYFNHRDVHGCRRHIDGFTPSTRNSHSSRSTTNCTTPMTDPLSTHNPRPGAGAYTFGGVVCSPSRSTSSSTLRPRRTPERERRIC